MMAKIMELRENYGLHRKAGRYVPDENGIPEQDRAYINWE